MGISRDLSRRLAHLESQWVDPRKAIIQSLPQKELEVTTEILEQLMELGWTPELVERARIEVPHMVAVWGLEAT